MRSFKGRKVTGRSPTPRDVRATRDRCIPGVVRRHERFEILELTSDVSLSTGQLVEQIDRRIRPRKDIADP